MGEERVQYLETWRRKRDGRTVFIAHVSEFSEVTYVHWRGPYAPGQRTRTGRVEIERFLRQYEFREPNPNIRIPVQFPPEPQTTKDFRDVVAMLDAEVAFLHAKARVWRNVAGERTRAAQFDQHAQDTLKERRAFVKKYDGKLPPPVFVPEKGGVYEHPDGFQYESWRVREKLGWEYRIVGTGLKVVEVDGGERYGACLGVICSEHKILGDYIAGPSQWSLENALGYAYRHFREKHVA